MDRLGDVLGPRIASLLDETAHLPRRVAVFDWDNTMIRGDIGDLVGQALLARGISWSAAVVETIAHETGLVPQARAQLLRDPSAELLASIAWRSALPDGTPAFACDVSSHHRASYAFLAMWLTGRSPAEASTLAEEVFAEAERTPFGARRSFGRIDVDAFARPFEPMVALTQTLRAAGFEVVVVTASPTPIVRPLARRWGIERVLGLELSLDAEGAITPMIDGPPAFRARSPKVFTFDEGKLAWIRHALFGDDAEVALSSRAPLPALLVVAGDTDTDHAMLAATSGLGVVVDRRGPRVTELARDTKRFVTLAPLSSD